jgi:hypothetical protein
MSTKRAALSFVILPVALLVLGLATIPAQAGLIAYYPFENNANDASGNGRHGAITGSLSVVAGHDGLAYAFNGGENFVTVPIDINPSNYATLTMGGWVNAGAADAIRGILSHDNGDFDRTLDIDNRGGGGWQWCAFTGSTVLCGPSVALDTWTFLAVRYNQSTGAIALTVDGAIYGTLGYPGSGWTNTTIGRNPSWDYPFVGVIDSVFFYDQYLTNEELEGIRQNGIQVIPEPSTFLLLGAGLLGLAAVARRRG